MKYLLLFFIKVYWYFWPKEERRNCIFKISCSKHVFKITKEKGFISGLKSLKDRYLKCRPGYKVFSENGKFYVRLTDGSKISEKEISSDIIAPYKNSILDFEKSLNS